MSTQVPAVYATFVALAGVAGAACAAVLLYDLGLRPFRVAAVLLCGATAAVFGAKMFSWIERGGPAWWALSWEITGGFRYPGGILGLVAVAPIVARLLPPRVTVAHVADVLALSICLAMVIVRIGCFHAGCCHGVPADLSWSVRYDAGSLAWAAHVERDWIDASSAASLAVHPLQIYFASGSLALALFLLWGKRRQSWPGQCFWAFLLLDGVIKCGLEQLRLEYRSSLVFAAGLFAMVGAIGLAIGSRRASSSDSGHAATAPKPHVGRVSSRSTGRGWSIVR